MSLDSKVQTEEFQRSSLAGWAIKQLIRHTILPQFPEQNMQSYLKQLDESSRNVEIAAENLAKLATKPRHFRSAMRALQSWTDNYLPEQGREIPRHLIYTEKDTIIPFRPEEDIMYAYMIAQLPYVANEIAQNVTARMMEHVADAFIAVNETGTEGFVSRPTVMPRYTGHDRLTLYAAQRLDRPYNCCPSLHVAYSIFIDNVAQTFVIDRSVFDSIRYCTKRMVNSVLYTKQHSLIDAAFGMLCARRAFEMKFPGRFNDFKEELWSMRKEHPNICYQTIIDIYDEASEIKGEFGEVQAAYFDRHGYDNALVAYGTDVNNMHFDTRTKELIQRKE